MLNEAGSAHASAVVGGQAMVAPLASPVATATVTLVLVVNSELGASLNLAVTVIVCAFACSATVPGDTDTSSCLSLASIVNVSGVTVPPGTVPVIRNVSSPSVTASSVTPKSVNDVQPLIVVVDIPVGMVNVTGEAGAVKSSPPPVADSGEDAPAVTVTSKGEVRSLVTPAGNSARTRTAGVSPSVRFFSKTDVVELSVSARNETSKSSSVIDNAAPVTVNPVAVPPTFTDSLPSAMASWVIPRPDSAAAVLLDVAPAGMVTVTVDAGAVKSAASAFSPSVNVNATSVFPVNADEEALVNAADTDIAPAFVAPSPTADALRDKVMASVIYRSASDTAKLDDDPVKRMVCGGFTAPSSARGVIVTSAVPLSCPLAMVISTVSALRV